MLCRRRSMVWRISAAPLDGVLQVRRAKGGRLGTQRSALSSLKFSLYENSELLELGGVEPKGGRRELNAAR